MLRKSGYGCHFAVFILQFYHMPTILQPRIICPRIGDLNEMLKLCNKFAIENKVIDFFKTKLYASHLQRHSGKGNKLYQLIVSAMER